MSAVKRGSPPKRPDALQRVVIEGIDPEIDGGRFPIKRTVGETVVVEADAFAEGHDVVVAVLRYARAGSGKWFEAEMTPLGNDRWRGSFAVEKVGRYVYAVEAWVDAFRTWRRDLEKRVDAGQDVSTELGIGAQIVRRAARGAAGADKGALEEQAALLSGGAKGRAEERVSAALGGELAELMARHPHREGSTANGVELEVVVDRERARFSAWYEMFPRSCSPHAGRHGTFLDCKAWLPHLEALGFDVLYLPPIHPVGRTNRKGKNNTVGSKPGDPGSPWAIGAAEGGHKSVHPELGTLEDFRALVAAAKERGIDVALDIAFQCAPDHPYVKEHPEWFRKRPDGSIQYAENPPKKYEDIYPFDFETPRWRELWEELLSVFLFWVEQGVTIFRVDNPHTKPFGFWEWVIAEVKKRDSSVLFLSEAFTRPKIMYRLAKLGFSQSYTYFAWRNTAWELRSYFEELVQEAPKEFFRPSLWPNTPDILTDYLQNGGVPAFQVRLVLAATLGASYGIYGPAYEACESRPKQAGSEEYLDSEKYEIKHRAPQRGGPVTELMARLNRVRRRNPALQTNRGLAFHRTDNDQLLCYSKCDDAKQNFVLVVCNLDPHHKHSGWTDLDLDALGLEEDSVFQVHDVISDARYLWQGRRNYVELDPAVFPSHVFRLRLHVRSEQDFDYYG